MKTGSETKRRSRPCSWRGRQFSRMDYALSATTPKPGRENCYRWLDSKCQSPVRSGNKVTTIRGSLPLVRREVLEEMVCSQSRSLLAGKELQSVKKSFWFFISSFYLDLGLANTRGYKFYFPKAPASRILLFNYWKVFSRESFFSAIERSRFPLRN